MSKIKIKGSIKLQREPFKIDKIKIKNLFGKYTHEISLHQDSRVTILVGINGSGKSTLLRIIDKVSRGDFDELHKEPFESIELGFGKRRYEFTKQEFSISAKFYRTPSSRPRPYAIPVTSGYIGWSYQDLVEEYTRIQNLLEHSELIDYPTDEILQQYRMLRDALIEYDSRTEPHLRPSMRRVESPAWLEDFLSGFKCHFISDQRLLKLVSADSSAKGYRRRTGSDRKSERQVRESIVLQARGLSSRIKDAQQAHSAKSIEVNQRYLNSMLHSFDDTDEPNTWEEYGREILDIESIEQKLMAAGLIKETKRTPLPESIKERSQDRTVASVIETYIEGSKEMYSVFAELLNQTTMFSDLVNSHLTDKKIVFGSDFGFSIQMLDGTPIKLSQLASGEQQYIVVTYELIFESPKHSLILIDEPELSLHAAWQEDFNNDLRRIGHARELLFLLATHSVSIINEEWDITYELSR